MRVEGSTQVDDSLQVKDSLWLKCGVKYIDHFAVTTTDLYRVLNGYMGIQGCELLRGPATNRRQNVDYAFIRTAQGMTVEILGVKQGSPITEHVSKGGGAYHLCFSVNNLDDAVRIAQENGAIEVVEQRTDDAFDGRRVAFLMHPEHGLFEFLEAYPYFIREHSTKVSLERSDDFKKLKSDSTLVAEKIIVKAFQKVLPELKNKKELEQAKLGTTANWDSLNQLLLVMEIEKLSQLK